MGADNWDICPKCKKEAQAEKARQAKVAGESYGQVSPEAYLEIFQQASQPINLDETLREDYEIGTTEDGKFYVSYSARCHKCGLSYKYEFTERDVLNPTSVPAA